ncbi:hypothetical protein D3C81_1324470 [compost metagenome]
MRLPVEVQGAQVVFTGALCHAAAVEPELRVLAECIDAVGVSRTREEFGVLGIVEQVHLDQADYLSTQSGCSLDTFLRDGSVSLQRLPFQVKRMRRDFRKTSTPAGRSIGFPAIRRISVCCRWFGGLA